MEILIGSSNISTEDLKACLEAELENNEDIELKTTSDNIRLRSPEMLLALIGLAGGALGILIKGLFDIAKARCEKKIIIRGKSGRTIEAPVSISKLELEGLVDAAKKLDIDKIEIY